MVKVLSLFDGMSCGQIALQRAGINVDKYYASEVEQAPMAVTQHNFPETIQVGDVTKLDFTDFKGELTYLSVVHPVKDCRLQIVNVTILMILGVRYFINLLKRSI